MNLILLVLCSWWLYLNVTAKSLGANLLIALLFIF